MTTTLLRPGEILGLLRPGEILGQIPASQFEVDTDTMKTLATLADIVFFASLIPEEGEPVRVAVVYHQQGAEGLVSVNNAARLKWDVTAFEPSTFTPTKLAKFSRGLEYGAQLVVVGGRDGEGDGLRIEGVARRLSDAGHVIRLAAPRPGVLAFERGSREILRFKDGEHVDSALDVFDNEGPIRTALNKITKDTSRNIDIPVMMGESEHRVCLSPTHQALRRLIQRMRATRAGGILAIMPEKPKETILQKEVGYRLMDSNSLSERIEYDSQKQDALCKYEDALRWDKASMSTYNGNEHHLAADASARLEAAIDDVAQLSAIDGAVLAGPSAVGRGLAIYGAGYKIAIPEIPENEKPIVVLLARDVAMERTEPYDIQQHGTRHRAAVSFAFHNPDGVAFVVSEDGPVKCALLVQDHVVLWPVRVSET